VLHGVATAGLAEVDGRRQRVAGAAVVAGDLVRGAEPLVDLGRDQGQLALERQREPLADRLQPLLVGAALDDGDPLEAEGAGAEVVALGAGSLLPRLPCELDRARVVAAAVQVAGRDQALRRGFAGEPIRREGLGGDTAGGERLLPVALELIDRRQATLRVG